MGGVRNWVKRNLSRFPKDFMFELTCEIISDRKYLIRGQKVMLDKDLAELYQVQTKVLKQAVKRKMQRFPDNFMLELSKVEYASLRSQIVTLKRGEL